MKTIITALLVFVAATTYGQRITPSFLKGKWNVIDSPYKTPSPATAAYFTFNDSSYTMSVFDNPMHGKYKIDNSENISILYLLPKDTTMPKQMKILVKYVSDTLKMQEYQQSAKWQLPENFNNTGFFVKEK